MQQLLQINLKNTLLFILFMVTTISMSAQVVYQGNAKSSPPHNSPFDVAVISNFNIPDGTNVLLVVGTRISGSTATVTSINYNGVTYTTQEIQQAINGGGNQSLWAIPMGNITGGGITANLTISWSGGPTGGYGGIAASFSNVNQTTPIDGNVNSITTSVSVATTLAGNMAIDFIGAGGTPVFSAGSGQTGPVINAPINSNANRISMSYELATGATTVMDWSNAGGSNALVHLGNYIIANSYAVLPVELTQFEAMPKNEVIELAWQTASEENNEGFGIERSMDGKNWEVLEFMPGQGTTVETQDYSFTDHRPNKGMNYYRLKQIDFDGAYEYSKIETVDFGEAENHTGLSIFPNPVNNQLNIKGGAGKLVISNVFGQVVQQAIFEQTNFSLDVGHLPKGQYILSITKSNGTLSTKRFVKQ